MTGLRRPGAPALPAILQAVAETYDTTPEALAGHGSRLPRGASEARRAYALLARSNGATLDDIALSLGIERACVSHYLSSRPPRDMGDRLAHAESIVRERSNLCS